MPSLPRKHPVIRAVAIIAIIGGLITMGRSLVLLQTALEQHNWPATPLRQDENQRYSYRVGEQDYSVAAEHRHQLNSSIVVVFYNPETPKQILIARPNFWWPLYLSMAGLIVFYAGLHLLREKERNIESLSFE